MPPWWIPPTTRIDSSPEAAIQQHDAVNQSTALCIYTDGSRTNGHVGAAAVAPSLSSDINACRRTEYMGESTTSTVYAAKLQAPILACESVLDTFAIPNSWSRCVIFTDSQTTIQVTTSPQCFSGQDFLLPAIRAVDDLRNHGHTIKLRWIPAHRGGPGNEAVDQATKSAAQQQSATSSAPIPPLESNPEVLVFFTRTAILQAM